MRKSWMIPATENTSSQVQQRNTYTTGNCNSSNEILLSTLLYATFVTRDGCFPSSCVWYPVRIGWRYDWCSCFSMIPRRVFVLPKINWRFIFVSTLLALISPESVSNFKFKSLESFLFNFQVCFAWKLFNLCVCLGDAGFSFARKLFKAGFSFARKLFNRCDFVSAMLALVLPCWVKFSFSQSVLLYPTSCYFLVILVRSSVNEALPSDLSECKKPGGFMNSISEDHRTFQKSRPTTTTIFCRCLPKLWRICSSCRVGHRQSQKVSIFHRSSRCQRPPRVQSLQGLMISI